MGVYYRLVNLTAKESIEPDQIGAGGVKHFAIVNGDAARMLAHLHIIGEREWTIVGDESGEELDLIDATEKYREYFNRFYPTARIERSDPTND